MPFVGTKGGRSATYHQPPIVFAQEAPASPSSALSSFREILLSKSFQFPASFRISIIIEAVPVMDAIIREPTAAQSTTQQLMYAPLRVSTILSLTRKPHAAINVSNNSKVRIPLVFASALPFLIIELVPVMDAILREPTAAQSTTQQLMYAPLHVSNDPLSNTETSRSDQFFEEFKGTHPPSIRLCSSFCLHDLAVDNSGSHRNTCKGCRHRIFGDRATSEGCK